MISRHHPVAVLLAELQESLGMAVDAIVAHKLRSALTLLGVLVGVFSIIVVMTAMRVLQSHVEGELSQLGANTFEVAKLPRVHFGDMGSFEKYWRRPDITLTHAMTVKERSSLAKSVGIETRFWGGQVSSRYDKSAPTVQVFGAVPDNFPARNWNIAEGRAIIETDVTGRRDVCVLGDGLAKKVFPFGSAIGESVKIDGINYSVVGVIEGKGQMMGGNQDNFAVIPLTTGLGRYGRMRRSLSILVQAATPQSMEETQDEVRGILRSVRKVRPGQEDSFEFFTNDSLIAQFRTFTMTVRFGAAIISSIALLAAGIGIMNIMLVSVTERTREIGIRRAVGAKQRNITTQFIMEAVILCEIGGLAGVGLGILGGNVLSLLMEVPPVLPVDWAVFGLLICSVVGIIFGSYPAIKAARLDPVESLRYE
jgi:putative ABC transport system permease protein